MIEEQLLLGESQAAHHKPSIKSWKVIHMFIHLDLRHPQFYFEPNSHSMSCQGNLPAHRGIPLASTNRVAKVAFLGREIRTLSQTLDPAEQELQLPISRGRGVLRNHVSVQSQQTGALKRMEMM